MDDTNIYINIDQNLPPMIINEDGTVQINFNFTSNININKCILKILDIKTLEEINIKKDIEPILVSDGIYNINTIIEQVERISLKEYNNTWQCCAWDVSNSTLISIAESQLNFLDFEDKKIFYNFNKILKKWLIDNSTDGSIKEIDSQNYFRFDLNNLMTTELWIPYSKFNFIVGKNNKELVRNYLDTIIEFLNANSLGEAIYIPPDYYEQLDTLNGCYKIQLEYEDGLGNKYFSNCGISKAIKKNDYNIQLVTVDNIYTVEYFTSLPDNLINFYKYHIIDDNENIVFSQDWTINDKNNYEIVDPDYRNRFQINSTILNSFSQYKINFSYKTNLGVEDTLEEYIQSKDIYPIIFPADIILTNNYENGYIKVSFNPFFNYIDMSTNYFNENDHYELYRTDNLSNFNIWEHLIDFDVNSDSIKTFYFKDYQVQQGIEYKYGIKSVNKNDIKTQMLQSLNSIVADFEDMFLIDSEFNVKVRFNPKMSSFKIDKSENKVETLGKQYPYIVRNGILKYKEMPISGLISFQMDDSNQLFNGNNYDFKDYTNRDLVSENITKERYFKNYILEWLNNNKYKVLKTPTEGNFIVQLMNISLTPIDSLGRMLHTFQATAYEMDEYNYENMKKYDIIPAKLITNNSLRIESICLSDIGFNPFNSFQIKRNNNIDLQLDDSGDYFYINFSNIKLEQIQLFGFGKSITELGILENEPIIEIIYGIDIEGNPDESKKTSLSIGNTRELIIPNASQIKMIKFKIDITHKLITNSKVKAGITYGWIEEKNIESQFNKIKLINYNINNNFYIETVDFDKPSTNDISYIGEINDNLTNFSFYDDKNDSSINGYFLIGDNFWKDNTGEIKSYLSKSFNSGGKKINIPQFVKIYRKPNIEDNKIYNFSVFIKTNDINFGKKQKIKINKLFEIPEFNHIEIDNLENIKALWIGKNLLVDIGYLQYNISEGVLG